MALDDGDVEYNDVDCNDVVQCLTCTQDWNVFIHPITHLTTVFDFDDDMIIMVMIMVMVMKIMMMVLMMMMVMMVNMMMITMMMMLKGTGQWNVFA